MTHTTPQTARHDPTHGYNPPVESTSCKSRLKTRLVRRLASLLRQLTACQQNPSIPNHVRQVQQEWQAILRAQGYGRSWSAWLLSFDFIHYVPVDIPDIPWLTLALQITRFDADAFARQEQILRKNHRKRSIAFAKAHTNNAVACRYLKSKKTKFLTRHT